MDQIERRSVGSSGVAISRIGLGGYQLGPESDEAPDVGNARAGTTPS